MTKDIPERPTMCRILLTCSLFFIMSVQFSIFYFLKYLSIESLSGLNKPLKRRIACHDIVSFHYMIGVLCWR